MPQSARYAIAGNTKSLTLASIVASDHGRVADKVKQRLMLCCYLSRRGHRRHRLYALARDRHQQA
jgi:hypothetical protein